MTTRCTLPLGGVVVVIVDDAARLRCRACRAAAKGDDDGDDAPASRADPITGRKWSCALAGMASFFVRSKVWQNGEGGAPWLGSFWPSIDALFDDGGDSGVVRELDIFQLLVKRCSL
jgi:hypothetical protein